MPSDHDDTPLDEQLVDRVLAALTAGTDDDPASLAVAVGADEPSVRATLEALSKYHHLVASARSHGPIVRPPSAGDFPTGSVLGDFTIEGVIGRGAMGVVYRARQRSCGDRPVALKLLPRALVAKDNRFVERFRREASLAARIHHPNVAEVYDLDASTPDLCFAMRLIDGPPLQAVLTNLAHRKQLMAGAESLGHVRRSVQIARGIADGLSAIHEQGLVHRDVKPSNVMMEGARGAQVEALDAVPVLVDFGLLRPVGEADLTGTRTLLGTPAYASPECLLGQDLDARADVFSLGVLLHDLLTITAGGARRPATAGLPEVRAVNPAVDERLAAILTMATESRRELRYEHGGAFRDDLDGWLLGGALRAIPSSALGKLRAWVRRDPARVTRLALALVLPVAVTIAVASWFISTSWSLTAASTTAARREASGDLVGAAEAYRSVFEASSQAQWLPWLTHHVTQANRYWELGGKLRVAMERLLLGARMLDGGSDGERVAEAEFIFAHHHLCEILLGADDIVAKAGILEFFQREVHELPEFRQRLAMDSLANYLIAQDMPQSVPEGLADILWQKLDAQPVTMASATRQAAAAAFGAIRTVSTWQRLGRLMLDNDAEVARLADVCSVHVYRWIHALDQDSFSKITGPMIAEWAAAGYARTSGSPDAFASIARHVALWERPPWSPPEASRVIDLAASVRAAVDVQSAGLAAVWRQADENMDRTPEEFQVLAGRRASSYDAAIWRGSPGENEDRIIALGDGVPVQGRPVVGGFHVERASNAALVPVVAGTVQCAAVRASTVVEWETTDRPGYVRFARPGVSRLSLRSTVPPSAIGLKISVLHMKGGRSVLRQSGSVMLRYSLTGLPWEHVAAAPSGSSPSDRPIGVDPDLAARTVLVVPMEVVTAAKQFQFVVEYLHGNTSHRVLRVDFEWAIVGR